jgi:DNA-directed RNA polymerase I subunit RPA12
MAAIGSLVFCLDCGALLEESEGRANALLKCHVCGAMNKDTSEKVIVTVSKPSTYPSVLRDKRSDVQQLDDSDRGQLAVINQTCEKCGRKEVRWYEQQLRSADEGTTIFYVCDCGHKCVTSLFICYALLTCPRWTQNN